MTDVQRIDYDMTPLKTKTLPVIWLVGPPGSGRQTQAEIMAKHLNYENVRVAQLLRTEALKDTDRGKIVKDCLGGSKKVPDVN